MPLVRLNLKESSENERKLDKVADMHSIGKGSNIIFKCLDIPVSTVESIITITSRYCLDKTVPLSTAIEH